MNNQKSDLKIEELPPAISLPVFLVMLLAVSLGAMVAVMVLPVFIPGISTSLNGSAPHAFWFLSRTSAIVAYLLLWCSMCLGLIITNKLARLWPGGPVAFDLHQYTSLLGVGFILFHGLILLGDRYLHTTFLHTAIPFALTEYHPFWVGLGQLGFYLTVGVTFSFYVRKQITPRRWRLLHYLSFFAFVFALLHAITSGTDSTAGWMQAIYWISGGTFLFLLIYRILVTVFKPVTKRQAA